MIVLLIAASATWAQGPGVPPKKPVAKSAVATPAKSVRPAVTAPVKTARSAIAPAKTVKPISAGPAKVVRPIAAAPVKIAKPAVAKKPAAKAIAKEPAAKKPAATPTAGKAAPKRSGRRDPFISPIVTAVNVTPCATGKQCLAIGELVVKGIARTQTGMLAMVENSAKKAYFLRENDPVFNGFVLKITMDSIVLRENVMDRLGNASTRNVVKKIAPTPVAAQGY